MAAYATVAELALRLADMELTDADRQVMEGILEDASNLARHYGTNWPDADVPPVVKGVVLAACMRHMRLLEALVASRAGDENLTWTDLREKTGTVFMDSGQQGILRDAASERRGLYVMQVTSHGAGVTPDISEYHIRAIPAGAGASYVADPIQYYPYDWTLR